MRTFSTLLLLLPLAPTVESWGKQGHEIVGNLASMLLSGRVRDQVSRMLRNVSLHDCDEECSPLAKVADWADQVRYRYHWSAPLHYIDVRDDLIQPSACPASAATMNQTLRLCYFDYARDCVGDNCVAGAIVNYTNRLLKNVDYQKDVDGDDPSNNQTENLMFLVHFIGDIHQPLHASRTTDRGGNSIHVTFDAGTGLSPKRRRNRQEDTSSSLYKTDIASSKLRPFVTTGSTGHHSLNLHAVWDDSIIEATLRQDHGNSRNALEFSLFEYIWQTSSSNPNRWNEWLRCSDGGSVDCAATWGAESFQMAVQYAYQNADGTEVVDGGILPTAYYVSRLPVVRERLAVAAIRLASTLERIFFQTGSNSYRYY